MVTPPTTTLSAAERAHQDIRAAIISGELVSDTMVSENDLATRLGMSRTPVRAALLRLQDEGWIAVFPQRGALIRGIGAVEAAEITDARHALETSALRRVPYAGREALAEALAHLVDRQELAMIEQSYTDQVALDIEFHRQPVLAAGNSILLGFYDRLRDRQSLMIARSISTVRSRAAEILLEHRELLALIRIGDWDRFDHVLRAHLLGTMNSTEVADPSGPDVA